MLKNPYLLAKIGAGTAENERNFAEILPKTDSTQALLGGRACAQQGLRARAALVLQSATGENIEG